MSPHELGEQLELDVVEKFNSIGIKAYPTKGSGNKGQAGDVQQNLFVIECKYRTKKDIRIAKNHWKKLKNEIPLQSQRLPLYILRNESGDTFAVLNIDDFFRILEGHLKYEGEI